MTVAPPAPPAPWWRPPTRAVVVIAVGLWLLAYLALTLGFMLDDAYFWPLAARRAVVCTFGAGLTLAMNGPTARIAAWPTAPRVLALAGLSLAATLAYSLANYAAFNWIATLMPQHMSFWPAMLYTTRLVFWFFLAGNVIYVAKAYSDAAQEAALALQSARAEGAQAQHKLLRYQLNPHFLFNTLNALHELVLDRQVKPAEAMILSLASFLRKTLDMDPLSFVTLRDELRIADEYLAIEAIRYGRRLMFTQDTAPEALDALLPALLLQPLIENAIKHGLSHTAETVTIAVTARVARGELQVEVTDDAPQRPAARRAKGGGLGLANTAERLAVIYAGAARFDAGPGAERGFAVRLALPARTPEAALEAPRVPA